MNQFIVEFYSILDHLSNFVYSNYPFAGLLRSLVRDIVLWFSLGQSVCLSETPIGLDVVQVPVVVQNLTHPH